MTAARPAIFIGSSVEGVGVAYALQENLEYDSEPTAWPQGVFTPSQPTLSELVEETRRTDFAIFAFTPDDIRLMRGVSASVPRDNVIFELGLFVGALGIERCFFVTPRNSDPLSLPSDLIGLTPLTYDAARSDGRLVAALGPAANQVRSVLRRLGSRQTPHYPTKNATGPDRDRTAYFIEQWGSPDILDAREVLRAGVPMHAMEDDAGRGTKALQLVFAFLESLADALLAGEVDEANARSVFETSIKSVWDRASTYLAPLNQADEWWDPLPKIAQLASRWKTTS